MYYQTNDEIARKLLQTTVQIEKNAEFASSALKKINRVNPLNTVPPLQICRALVILNDSEANDKKPEAAAVLVDLLNNKPIELKCQQCGEPFEAGMKFCENCGNKL
ncbi:MAG: zinc ribbon domain-containing protein [Dehalococcoidales bacterium]